MVVVVVVVVVFYFVEYVLVNQHIFWLTNSYSGGVAVDTDVAYVGIDVGN